MMLLCIFVLYSYSVLFFFFKQNTAYEMRISDWSSDVCSSDLSTSKSLHLSGVHLFNPRPGHIAEEDQRFVRRVSCRCPCKQPAIPSPRRLSAGNSPWLHRSEEHTSELQSLMRISYAVLCLKKTTNNTQ